MRIELLKTTPDRAGRYFVQFDNGRVLRLYRQTVEDFSLYSGMELSQERFEESDQKQVKRAVYSLLRRGHSYRVIREALNDLCFDADEFPEDE